MNKFFSLLVDRIGKAVIFTSITGIGFVVVAAKPASAATFNCPSVGSVTNCNTLLTLDQNGTVSLQILNSRPYDGSDDNLVGFLNNSTSLSVSKISLSGSGIFGFDGDGLSAFTGVTYAPDGYAGPNTTFTITNVNTGFVNFTTPLQPGQGAYFSLENAPSAGGFTVGTVTTTPATVPEPFTIVGTLVGGAAAFRMRKRLKVTNKL
jgi:hypothetical protein